MINLCKCCKRLRKIRCTGRCGACYQKHRVRTNPVYAARQKAWMADYRIRYGRDCKQRAMNALGGKCACCGESRVEFLAVDHIKGGGREDRKSCNGSSVLYRRIIKNPDLERYRVLCHNCNFSIGAYGYCPHQIAA